jgi:hypothetical protein
MAHEIVFKGAKSALPVQNPTKYELVINLKTAKALTLRANAATAASMAPGSCRLIALNSIPTGTTAWMAANWPMPAAMVGSRNTAARVTPGEILESADHIIALNEVEHRPIMSERFPGWESRIQYWDNGDVALVQPNMALALIEAQVERLLASFRDCQSEK